MYVLTLLEYGSSAFIATSKTNQAKLQKVQNEALRICLNLPRYIRIDLLHEYGGIDRVEEGMNKLNKRLLESMTASNKDIAGSTRHPENPELSVCEKQKQKLDSTVVVGKSKVCSYLYIY